MPFQIQLIGMMKIEQIMSWIDENTSQFAEKEVEDPYEILNREEGIVLKYLSLFNALVKSIGIPARSVKGYVFDLKIILFEDINGQEVEIDGNGSC